MLKVWWPGLLFSAFCLACLVTAGRATVPPAPSAVSTQPAAISSADPDRSRFTEHASRPQLDRSYGRLPLSFERNDGQTDEQVKFLARGRGYTLFLTPTEAVLALRSETREKSGKGETDSCTTAHDCASSESRTSRASRSDVLRMRLEGANPSPIAHGLEPLPGIVNYFIGNDPTKWRTNIPTYAKVEYKEIYPGIDLAYYGNQGKLEYDLIVAPGADPSQIKLAFEGADDLRVDEHGDLILTVAGGKVLLQKPLVYQLDQSGKKQMVAGNYVLHASRAALHEVRVALASYDTSKPLVIDPVLFYATYLGGTGGEEAFGNGIAVDAGGDVYVIGHTLSADFTAPCTAPCTALDTTLGSTHDAFVTKMNANGSALLYATYLGGNNNDFAHDIAVDTGGQAYVAGTTGSSDFPTACTGPSCTVLSSTLNGSFDAFITKFNAAGNLLVYSTYLGGNGLDTGDGIAVDTAGNTYLTGQTASSDLTASCVAPCIALDTTLGGTHDGFVTKVNSIGSALLYSTYLGGNNVDSGKDIAVDAGGSAYITGATQSTNFTASCTTPCSVLDSSLGGPLDAYVVKFNGAGNALIYSTYLGGSSGDSGSSIAIDAAGNGYVTGQTSSSDLTAFCSMPCTVLDSNPGSTLDAYVIKLNAAGTAPLFATYFGGSGLETGSGIAVDAAGAGYVIGNTSSASLTDSCTTPCTVLDSSLGGTLDAYIVKFNAAGTALIYFTFLGGSGEEQGLAIAVDTAGNTYVTGITQSADFTVGCTGPSCTVLDGFLDGPGDAIVAKICNDPPPGTTPGTWMATGSLIPGRREHTATLLADGRVLVAGGTVEPVPVGQEAVFSNARLYDPAAGTFTATTGSMTTPRASHTATLLPSGKVLLTGGFADENFTLVSSAEVYDPQTQLFMATANSMPTARVGHTATLLANGKVLVAGLGTADLYDPATNSFTPTGGAMNVSREGHTATLLADGRVLLTGGRSGPANATIVQTAELFNPTLNGGTGGFVFTGTTMNLPRANHTATLLPSGKVLIAGGLNTSGTPLQTAEIFDPTAIGGLGSFSTTGGAMASARARHTTTLLPDGTVLVAGGYNGTTTFATAELFDWVGVSFGPTGSMATARGEHTATALANGQVLVTGGAIPGIGDFGLSSAELYTPALCGAAAPGITGINPPSAAVGTSVTITGTGFGATQGSSTVTFNSVDAGAATGWTATQIVITVPAAATTGNVVVTVGGVPSNGFAFTVLVPDFSLSASPASGTVVQGQPASYTVTLGSVNGFNSPVTLSVTSGLPAGATATFNPPAPNPATTTSSTLTIQTTSSTAPGTYPTIVIHGDGGGQMHDTSMELVVQANALPPAASALLSVTTPENTPTIITLSGNDPEGAPLTFTITSSPTKGTIGPLSAPACGSGTCTATVTYTPTGDLNGMDSFTYRVSDGVFLSNTGTVELTITAAADAPVAVNDLTTVAQNSGATSIAVLANDTDPDNITPPFNAGVTITAVTGTGSPAACGTPTTTGAGGSVSCSAGGVTYTPAGGFTGTDSFTYRISDGSATATATVTIRVVAGAVNVSLDTRALGTTTFEVQQSGTTVVTLGSDAVHDLALVPGAYTLRVPAGGGTSLNFTVGAAGCDLTL